MTIPHAALAVARQFRLARAADSPWADLVVAPVVVDRQHPVIEIAHQGHPALEAVVEYLGDGRAFVYQLALRKHPDVQGIGDESRPLLANSLSHTSSRSRSQLGKINPGGLPERFDPPLQRLMKMRPALKVRE